MIDNYPAGVSHSDFEEDTTTNAYWYINRLTEAEQDAVCADYLDYSKGWDRYHEAHDEQGLTIKDYCQKLDSFWDWIGRE